MEHAELSGRWQERIGRNGSAARHNSQGQGSGWPGVGSEALAESARPGFPLGNHHAGNGGEAPGESAAERRGSELAESERESSGPEHEHHAGKRPGGEPDHGTMPGAGGAELADIAGGRFGELREPSRSDRQPAGSGRELARPLYFPPYRTGDWDRWADVLVRAPWLRPSLSQAEIDAILRRMAPGLADQLEFGHERIDRLRSVGEGVTPLAMAFAFRVLAEAHGIGSWGYESAELILTA